MTPYLLNLFRIALAVENLILHIWDEDLIVFLSHNTSLRNLILEANISCLRLILFYTP